MDSKDIAGTIPAHSTCASCRRRFAAFCARVGRKKSVPFCSESCLRIGPKHARSDASPTDDELELRHDDRLDRIASDLNQLLEEARREGGDGYERDLRERFVRRVAGLDLPAKPPAASAAAAEPVSPPRTPTPWQQPDL